MSFTLRGAHVVDDETTWPTPDADLPRFLLEAMPDPVLAIASDTFEVLYANATASRVFAWSPCVGRTLDDLDLDEGGPGLTAALSCRPALRCETRVRRDGRRYVVESVPLQDTAVGDGAMLTIWRAQPDVAPAKDAEEFVATVSHELRTPLTSIRGALGLVLSGASGQIADRTRGLLEIAHRNAGRLVLLVNDILDLEKLTSGHMTFDLERHDVGAALIAARDANASFAESFDITVACDLPDRPVLATVDAARLHQVLTNLISNACKFSHPGSTVTLRLDACAPDHLTVAVQDQGIGIPKNAMVTIFDRFNQAGSVHRNRSGSTGLGLAIVKSIVEHHGGSITLDSVEGEGTCVRFTIPRDDKAGKGDAR